jgi:hypothetical protein
MIPKLQVVQGLKKYVQNWKMSICDFVTHVKLYQVDLHNMYCDEEKKCNQHTFPSNSKTLLNKILMFYIFFGGTTWLSKFQMLVFFQWQNVKRCLHGMMDLKNYHNFAIFCTRKIWKFWGHIWKMFNNQDVRLKVVHIFFHYVVKLVQIIMMQ